MSTSRTLKHIAAARADDLFLVQQISGRSRIQQERREVLLETGDFTLVDPLVPYSAALGSGSELFSVKIPRPALRARLGTVTDLSFLALRRSQPEHRFTSAFLCLLAGHPHTISDATASLVGEQMLDLVAVSIAHLTRSVNPRLSSAGALALFKLRAAIDARVFDPGLNSRTVAAAAGISVRYANALLSKEGTSISRLILAKRLELCRKALSDPSQDDRRISDIAYGWGFSDMTHFGRRFKELFGLSPKQYRNQCIADREQSIPVSA
jgi:AraC-like DNA-binding protein